MATREVTKTTKLCDVTGSEYHVETYRFRMWKDGGEESEDGDTACEGIVDLCPAALKRAQHFMIKGIRPAGKTEVVDAAGKNKR